MDQRPADQRARVAVMRDVHFSYEIHFIHSFQLSHLLTTIGKGYRIRQRFPYDSTDVLCYIIKQLNQCYVNHSEPLQSYTPIFVVFLNPNFPVGDSSPTLI